MGRGDPSIVMIEVIRQLQAAHAAGPGSTVDEMAQATGVCAKTIRRKLDFIRQAGLPVLESVDPERRKRYKLDPKRLPAAHVSFEPLEAAALHVAAALMQAMEGLPLAKEIERVRAKVASAVPAAFRPELDRFVTALAAAPSGRHDYRAFGTHFLNLMDAVAERWPVMIEYRRPGCDESATYRVEPYLVHCHAGSVYLVGRRTDRNELRNYALGRIEGLRVLDEDTFDPDPAFNAARYVDEGFGGFHEGELVDVAVHFAPAAARVVLERRWHSSQRHELAEDGSAVLRFRTAGPAGVLYWAMSYLPHARVIEPAPLAERQREILREWLDGAVGPVQSRPRPA